MSVCMNVWEVLECVHGVCEWMEGHNDNKLYIVAVAYPAETSLPIP